jgi:signal transduction histidine kinase/ligand-binding sensor domain-containing protein
MFRDPAYLQRHDFVENWVQFGHGSQVQSPHPSICSMSSLADIRWSKIPNATGSMVRVALIGLLTAITCTATFAAQDHRAIAQYAHTAWTEKDGAPRQIQVITQTKDGLLWLGTHDGLYRFDGVVFEHYEPLVGPPLPAGGVVSLLALPDGDLWIAIASRAIVLLRNNRAQTYTERDGVPAGPFLYLAQDRDGTIWVGGSSGLARLEGNRWKEVGKDWNFLGKSAGELFVDRKGTLWVATEDTIVFLPQGSRTFEPTSIHIGQVRQITQAPNGKLWMAEISRSVRPVPLGVRLSPPDETEIRVGSGGICFDRDESLWISTEGDGLIRVQNPERLRGMPGRSSSSVENYSVKDGLSNNFAMTSFQDREGNIWVGTLSGLDRFHKGSVVPVYSPISRVWKVIVPRAEGGVLAFGTNEAAEVRESGMSPVTDNSHSCRAYLEPNRTVWIPWMPCDNATFRSPNGQVAKFSLPEDIKLPFPKLKAMTEDHAGRIWAAFEGNGLYCWEEGAWIRFAVPAELTRSGPTAAFSDDRGQIWFGYLDGTIFYLDAGKIRTISANEFSVVGGARIFGGNNGHVWVGGTFGLGFFDGYKLRSVLPADAERFGTIVGLEETADGSLWICGEWGVIRIEGDEIRKFLEIPSYRVHYDIFDSFDGLPGNVEDIPGQPETSDTKGRLWFVTSKAIAWLDPTSVPRIIPPPVSIRTVIADGKYSDPRNGLTLPAQTGNLQIGYGAINLSAGERIRYRYELDGTDKGWQDAGVRRNAFYTNLGPGIHRFHVSARNVGGDWNQTEAVLTFSIEPAWFQTDWFRAACVCAALLLLWLLYQLRLSQLRHQFSLTLEARVDERTRIARDLHDTLLQSFNALLLRFQAASNLLPAHPDEAKERVDRAIEQASAAISEGRDAVHELRSGLLTTTDLAQGITTFAEELLEQPSVSVRPDLRVQIEGTPVTLNSIVRDETFRIAAEAVRNAIRHASAKHIEVEIRYDEQQLRVRIRDDGKGIDPAVVDQGHAPGHYGLRGMRERAKLVGGSLEVWSEPGSGTEVELTIPGGSAYDRNPGSWRSAFTRNG